MKWEKMVEIEPALGRLYEDVCSVECDEKFCANAVWYGYGGHLGFKPRLMRLVGWDAKNPKLMTEEAYDVAYDKLYNALPDCQHGRETGFC